MIHSAEKTDPLTRLFWQRQFAAPLDIVATLAQALGFAWVVQREIDWQGEVSVIALPANDDETMPAFVLYEQGGLAQVATVKHDEWQPKRGYATAAEAVAAIVCLSGGTNGGCVPYQPLK